MGTSYLQNEIWGTAFGIEGIGVAKSNANLKICHEYYRHSATLFKLKWAILFIYHNCRGIKHTVQIQEEMYSILSHSQSQEVEKNT